MMDKQTEDRLEMLEAHVSHLQLGGIFILVVVLALLLTLAWMTL